MVHLSVFYCIGQLVCVLRSVPRLIRSTQQEATSVSPSVPSRGRDPVPRLFQPPLQLSDAVHRLAIAAKDKAHGFLEHKDTEDTENILRIMNNLLSFSHSNHAGGETHQHSTRSAENVQGNNNYSLVPKRMTVVHVIDKASVVVAHRQIAERYLLAGLAPEDLCKKNAEVARAHSRFDHERVFRSLAALICTPTKKMQGYGSKVDAAPSGMNRAVQKVLETLYVQPYTRSMIPLISLTDTRVS